MALIVGGVGEHGDFGVGAGEADLVAGEGGQVSEQAVEAAQWVAGGVVLGGVNRTGTDGGSGYWISTRGWSVRFLAPFSAWLGVKG